MGNLLIENANSGPSLGELAEIDESTDIESKY